MHFQLLMTKFFFDLSKFLMVKPFSSLHLHVSLCLFCRDGPSLISASVVDKAVLFLETRCKTLHSLHLFL